MTKIRSQKEGKKKGQGVPAPKKSRSVSASKSSAKKPAGFPATTSRAIARAASVWVAEFSGYDGNWTLGLYMDRAGAQRAADRYVKKENAEYIGWNRMKEWKKFPFELWVRNKDISFPSVRWTRGPGVTIDVYERPIKPALGARRKPTKEAVPASRRTEAKRSPKGDRPKATPKTKKKR